MWLTRWASMLDVYVGSAAFCSPPRLLRHLEGSCCVQGATSHGGKLASRQWICNKVTGPLDLRAVHCTARTSSVLLAGVPAQAPPPAPPFSTALLPALLAAAVSGLRGLLQPQHQVTTGGTSIGCSPIAEPYCQGWCRPMAAG